MNNKTLKLAVATLIGASLCISVFSSCGGKVFGKASEAAEPVDSAALKLEMLHNGNDGYCLWERKVGQLKHLLDSVGISYSVTEAQILFDDDSVTCAEKKRKEYFEYASALEQAVLNDSTDLKIAYLTFDDGPYNYTPQFVEVLAKYDILGTFFQIAKDHYGSHDVSGYYELVHKAGHTTGNHSYSHKLKRGPTYLYSSVDYFIDDIIRNREFIQDKLGITTDVMRFPGGSPTAGRLKPEIVERLHELGYGYVDWDAETHDGTQSLSVEEYTANAISTTGNKKMVVVLMHDYQKNTLLCLPTVIEKLQKKGYVFLPLWRGSVKVK